MLPRRTFIARAAGGALCACVASAAWAQTTSPTGKWMCPPCGCSADGKLFDKAGGCPACGMDLIPQDAPKPQPAPAPAPAPK
jgi:hypothetical protein